LIWKIEILKGFLRLNSSMNLQMKSATKKNINPVIAKEIKYFLENKIPLTDDAFLSLDMKIKILEDKTKCENCKKSLNMDWMQCKDCFEIVCCDCKRCVNCSIEHVVGDRQCWWCWEPCEGDLCGYCR
tara:strand:- start:1234 stop:1617 length:384 start_codon:yes stop_codon:yes gene_type:complete